MAERQPTVVLTDEQIAVFHREGYLSVDVLTDQADVAKLRESYDRLFAQRAGREAGDQFDLAGADEEGKQASLPQILNPAKYAPEMNESQLLVNVAAIGKQLLGPDAKASFAHAIFKPARHGAATPWHQDAAYWTPEFIHKSISVWVPLQEATLENGCMNFVPRSQNQDVLPHRSINNDPRIHGLELAPDQMAHTREAVACPLPPGGGTFHGGYMLHYTAPNRTDIPRRAIILGVGVAGQKRTKPVRFPWLAEKHTARGERARQAGAKG